MHIMVQWVQGPRFFISNNVQMIPEDLSLSGKDWDCPNPSHIFAVWPCPPCYCWFTQHKHLTQNKLIRALLQDFFEPELGRWSLSLWQQSYVLQGSRLVSVHFSCWKGKVSEMMGPIDQEMGKNLATFISLVSLVPLNLSSMGNLTFATLCEMCLIFFYI